MSSIVCGILLQIMFTRRFHIGSGLILVVSHRLLNHMRLLAPEKGARFTPLRWAESFYAVAPVIMGRVLKIAGIDEVPLQLIIYFMGESIDPNVNRERLLSPWVTAANSQSLNTTD